MHVVDNSEPWWRALFNYCFSFQIIDGMRDENVDPLVARELLEELRQKRQEQYAEPFPRKPKVPAPWQSNES